MQTEHLASEVMAAVSAGVREGTAMTRTKCLNNDWKHKIHSKIYSLHMEGYMNDKMEEPQKEDVMA